MKKEIINVQGAAKPVGPYSHAVRCGQMLFVSGQIPLDANGRMCADQDIATQARLSLENVRSVLRGCGLDLQDVVKVTAFLCDISDFPKFNEVYAGFFPNDPPARSVVAVKSLPGGARVEVEVTAVFP